MTDLSAEARALPFGQLPEPVRTRTERDRRDEGEPSEVAGSVGQAELEALHPKLFCWALSRARGNRELALEALQASYLLLLEGGVSAPSQDWKAWLFGVVRRKALSIVRRERLRRALLLRWGRSAKEPAAPTPLECATLSEKAERIRRELQRLSPRQRSVLELVFDNGLTLEQAARVLDIRVGTARTHYERGKRILLERMRINEQR